MGSNQCKPEHLEHGAKAVTNSSTDNAINNGVALSNTLARTIRDLERLVEEAVKLAETAGVPTEEDEQSVLNKDAKGPYRAALSLAQKLSRDLEDRSPEGHAHMPVEGAISRRSTSASQNTTSVAARKPIMGSRLLPPEPAAGQTHETRIDLVRGREASSNRATAGPPFLALPEVGARGAFTRRSNTPAPPTPPSLQLNGDELGPDQDEDKSPLLRTPRERHERHFTQMFGVPSRHVSIDLNHSTPHPNYKIDLRGTQHVDVAESPDDVDVHSTCHHAQVARNWPRSRKRFTAWSCCINAACLGILLGIYAGEVPAIQYVIVDLQRQVILGNVFLYIGLAISTMLFWPLPLLHGRKPYTLVALVVTLCLQIPQGIMVLSFRDPDIRRYRIILLLSRGVSGFVLGFVNINNFASLLDVFGASLQSDESHEAGNPYDVRRHGGGMGLWLAIWSSCSIASICVGFLIGAVIISSAAVDWGFWISSLVLLSATFLNVIAPEVRRSAFRRTLTEISGEDATFSRVARGELKLHLTGNGPY